MATLFTLTVEYHTGHTVNGATGSTIADLSEAEANNLAGKIWAVGLKIPTTPGNWEIASPYMIRRVWIIEQKNSS